MPLLTTTDLELSLDHLRAAPADTGTLAMIVRRPDLGAREVVAEARLDVAAGLVGDSWLSRATSRAVSAGSHLDAMITVMNARMARLLGETEEAQAMAGDQLYVDLDISHDNLPAGARLAVGPDAVLVVSAKPHSGCRKFQTRFGDDALAFVNSEVGSRLRLRGLNARVEVGGIVRSGDVVRRVG